jgi:hypothetical protein
MSYALQEPVRAIVAASTSPFFKEQLPLNSEESRGRNALRLSEFEAFSMSQLARLKAERVHLMVGSDDFHLCVSMFPDLVKAVGEKAIPTVVPEAPHCIANEPYMMAILGVLSQEIEVIRSREKSVA